jgi:methanethiol S-methyltransferase
MMVAQVETEGRFVQRSTRFAPLKRTIKAIRIAVNGCASLTYGSGHTLSLDKCRRNILLQNPNIRRLYDFVKGTFSPAPGRARIGLALAMGAACQIIFSVAALSMIGAMFFGLSLGLGTVPWPWASLANSALLLQFPFGHSVLLSKGGRQWLAKAVPGSAGRTLSTTTYAIIASLQLLVLFALWTPSGIIWWRAEG